MRHLTVCHLPSGNHDIANKLLFNILQSQISSGSLINEKYWFDCYFKTTLKNVRTSFAMKRKWLNHWRQLFMGAHNGSNGPEKGLKDTNNFCPCERKSLYKRRQLWRSFPQRVTNIKYKKYIYIYIQRSHRQLQAWRLITSKLIKFSKLCH